MMVKIDIYKIKNESNVVMFIWDYKNSSIPKQIMKNN
jgi:hypothetical protein